MSGEFLHARWEDVPGSLWRWPNFTPKEMAQRGWPGLSRDRTPWIAGRTPVLVVPEFMDRLQALRESCGFPLVVSSAYRSPEYNDAVSDTGRDGPHTTGRAVDVLIWGERFHLLFVRAVQLGFTGIGVKQHGEFQDRFVHLDDLPAAPPERPRPWGWSYP